MKIKTHPAHYLIWLAGFRALYSNRICILAAVKKRAVWTWMLFSFLSHSSSCHPPPLPHSCEWINAEGGSVGSMLLDTHRNVLEKHGHLYWIVYFNIFLRVSRSSLIHTVPFPLPVFCFQWTGRRPVSSPLLIRESLPAPPRPARAASADAGYDEHTRGNQHTNAHTVSYNI